MAADPNDNMMDFVADIDPEELQVFMQEADEQLQLLDEDLVKLERDSGNTSLLQEIFRAAHTIKGSAGMLGFRPMADVAHVMESALDRVRHGTLDLSTEVADALLASLDVLRALKEELAAPSGARIEIDEVVAEMDRVGSQPDSSVSAESDTADEDPFDINAGTVEKINSLIADGQTIYAIRVQLIEGTAWAPVRCFQTIQELTQRGEIVLSNPSVADIEEGNVSTILHVLFSSLVEEDDIRPAILAIEDIDNVEINPYTVDFSAVDKTPDSAGQEATQQRAGSQNQTVRIDVDRLDLLMNTIGELVIDGTRIFQLSKTLASRYREDDLADALGQTSTHIVKVVDELQEIGMRVRMLPVGTAFNGLPRMVRDLARQVGKKVDFQIEGQDTEIDRTIIERIRDPLLHLLRNAIDHGIETPEARVAAGKPETAVVRLAAFHDQGHIVIAVEDDGRGIDTERVRESAINKGMLSQEAAGRLSEAESLDLIFMPGASTAEKTTDISGRGVGMDIVRSNIEAINGFVNVETNLGTGTKFSLTLPLTLATLQTLLVSVEDTLYAMPLIYVLETVRIEAQDINTIEGREAFMLRGRVVPLLRLGSIVGSLTRDSFTDTDAYVVVVRFGEKIVGLGVDTLVELQEIVVKSLGNYIGDVKGVAGVSILGDGRVVLILDVLTLLNTALARTAEDLRVATH